MSDCFLYNSCNHKDCDKDVCPRRYKMENLYALSCLSASQMKPINFCIDADGTDEEEFKQLMAIAGDIVNFVKDGKNLFIHSKICGNGKTSWSITMIQKYFNRIWPMSDLTCKAIFISVPRFLLALKDNIKNNNQYAQFILANAANADLVVWDDIAAKNGTEYEISQLLGLIDGRLSAGKSNIYTSNLGPDELINAVDKRLASRICESTIIELNGADKRRFFGGNK